MVEFLLANDFFTRIPGSYSKGKIGVRLHNGTCSILYDGEFVWTGSIGQDAIDVIEEYLDL